MKAAPRDRWWWALVLVGMSGLVGWFTWPAWLHPGQNLLCHVVHPDCGGNYWLLGWVADQVAHGRGLGHNDRYYWPVGDSPFLAGNGGEGLLNVPLQALLGWPLGPNLLLFLLLVGNGVAAAFAARSLRASWPGALLAAAAIGAGAYPLREMSAGRFTQADLVPFLLFLGLWVRVLDSGGRARALGAGAALAVTSVLYWYHGLFAVIAGALLLGGSLLDRRRLPATGDLLVFCGSFLGLAAGPLIWFLVRWTTLPGTDEDVFPHPEAVRDSLEVAWPFLVRGGRFVTQALPAPLLLLALLPFLRRRPCGMDLALAAMALAFYLLALGPRFEFLGLSPFNMLYGLAPPLRRFWWPSRHFVVVAIALALLAARALPAPRRPVAAVALAIGMAALMPLSLGLQGVWPRVQVTAMLWPPDFYADLAHEEGEILLELPLSPRIAVSQKPLLFQSAHHKTLLNGHAMWVDRVRPPAWDASIEANSFLRLLRDVDAAKASGSMAFDGRDLRGLIDAGLGTIVLNAENYPASLQAAVDCQRGLLSAIFGKPTNSMTRAWAWGTSNWKGQETVEVKHWEWPSNLRPPEPSQPVQLMTPASRVFTPPKEGWSSMPTKGR